MLKVTDDARKLIELGIENSKKRTKGNVEIMPPDGWHRTARPKLLCEKRFSKTLKNDPDLRTNNWVIGFNLSLRGERG